METRKIKYVISKRRLYSVRTGEQIFDYDYSDSDSNGYKIYARDGNIDYEDIFYVL
jgi:hypothetical protein